MIRILEENHFLEGDSFIGYRYLESLYVVAILIPKEDNIKVPIDLGKARELNNSLMWMFIEDNHKDINPENYLYLGKRSVSTKRNAEKYLDRIEKRLLDYNRKLEEEKNKRK